MAKKPTVHNHIDNVTVSIDYTLLAKAILEEQSKNENKSKKRSRTRISLMSWCNGLLYATLYSHVICRLINIWCMYINGGKTSLYMCILYTVVGIPLTLLMLRAQQETFDDSKDETITHFNTTIAMVALVVSIASLIKG